MNTLFKEQTKKSMEVYVDDILVKSKQASTHVADLVECYSKEWYVFEPC